MEASIAKVGSIALTNFGVMSFLAWGMNVAIVKEALHPAATFFGILTPGYEEPPYDITTVCLTSFTVAVAAVNLLALKEGDAEKPGARIAREDLNAVTFMAMTLTYIVAMVNGMLVGTFGQFWTAFVTVQALAHYRIVSSGFGSTRKAMRNNLFKGATDNLDAINSIMYMSYGVLYFLALGLNLEFLQGLAASAMTMFGVLGPDPPAFTYHMYSIYGGSCALGLAALSVPAFSGAAEDSDYAAVRRTASIVFWVSGLIAMAALPVNGSFYTFWSGTSAVLAVLLSAKNATSKAKAD